MLSSLQRSMPLITNGLRCIGGAPRVTDSMIAITAVLPDGRRLPLLARTGVSLADALAGSPHAELAECAPALSPKHGHEAHVRVAHNHPLPPLDEHERDRLSSIADDVQADSRLASSLILDASWSGSVVSLSPLHPYRSL